MLQFLITLSLFFFIPLMAENKPLALVSIAPYEYFVKKIGGDLVDIQILVPPGANSHTFEPSAKKIIESSKAFVWFQIGEPFEERAYEAMRYSNPKLKAVDLKTGVPLISEGEGLCSHHAEDPHIWLSPKLAKIQAATIANALVEKLPEQKQTITKNLVQFQTELDSLDLQIRELFKNSRQRTILLSHPAFAYYCKDFGLKQLSLESEGREASSKKVSYLLKTAKELGIRTVFAQKEHSSKGAERIAEQLGGKVIFIDPLSPDWANNLIEMSKLFAGQP